jgi:NDP-sugar pyrophosphorylase family protein
VVCVQVVCGEGAASKVQKHIQKESTVTLQSMTVHVVKAASETGSADAVRLVADRLTGQDVVVMSGDTITNMALASVLFTHSMQRAGMTTVLSKNATSASANTKVGKAPEESFSPLNEFFVRIMI